MVLAAGACRPAKGPAPPPRPPDLFLISLDACRADHLSCYGYDRPTSPFLDGLAARGTRFALAFANTQGTVPSHTTLLTSLYQETHRMFHFRTEAEKRWQKVPADAVMLQELLRARGYRTLAVTDGGHMARTFGFDRGFDEFRDGATGVESGTRKLLGLLGTRPDPGRPVFAFLHTYQIHSPYDPPEPERTLFGPWPGRIGTDSGTLLELNRRGPAGLQPGDLEFLRGQYDGGIRYTDRVLEGFFRDLEAAGFLRNAVVAVTADHGEEFGEHGGLLHRGMLYDESIRVPLILAGVRVPAGRVDGRMVSLVDVAPTLLALAGAPAAPGMAGRDLLAAGGPEGEEEVFTQYGPLRYAVRTREWKLIRNTAPPSLELYDLRRDSGERENLAGVRSGEVRRLERLLWAWREALPALAEGPGPAPGPTEEDRARLRGLGYLGGQ
jgi:arylsulfatase A-like enzyme